ncbi:MAG TPA: beta-propeller domain-containing protein [Acidimicrobiales bacterium]|nr:beta-propeller domain-containing protein [Acidimicrobiales bacterium]
MQARRSLAVVIGVLLVAGLVVAVSADGGDDTAPVTAALGTGSETAGAGAPSAWRLRARQPDPVVEAGEGRPDPAVPPTPVAVAPVSLRAAGTCQEVLADLKREGLERVTPWGLPGIGGAATMPESSADGSGGGQATAGSGGDGGYSTTNVQEQGVDEPDIVKNSSTRIVTLFDGHLRVLTREGSGLAVASTVALGVGYDAEMLLVGDHAVVISRVRADRPATRVVVVNVGDAAAATVTSDVTVSGHHVSARSADGVVRLVVASDGPSLRFTHPAGRDDAAVAEALARNREVVDRSSLGDWLPEVATPAGCGGVLTPGTFSGFGTTTVLTLDPAAGELVDSTSIVAAAHEVYASRSHLYVAAGVWPDDGRARPGDEVTHVHRFDVRQPHRTRYEASGAVAGHLLRPFLGGGGGNLAQWAMSEHGGDLRVATTLGDGDASTSTVTVLRQEGAALVPIGAVTGLGPTERIYAVRFMGDRGYVVTYRLVDPLYVIDLADPRAPRVLGELKVPGFSAYLHPVGDGILLGIGQDDPDEDGMVDGTQVSLFDVTDATRPRRIAHLRLGERGTFSAVENDHRAFTWWPSPGRAVLPLFDGRGFDGAVALEVTTSSISEVGRVEHRTGEDGTCTVSIRRSRVIDGALYTFSAAGVRVDDLDDLRPLSALEYDDAVRCEPPPEPPPSSTTTTTTPGLLPGPGS